MGQSRHLEICEAIKTAIVDDTFLIESVPSWVTVKRYWNRTTHETVEGKGFIAPLRRSNPTFENIKVKWECPVLVGVMIPSDGSVKISETDDDLLMQIAERIEDIFSAKGKNSIPTSLKNVGQSRTPDTEKFYYEVCSVRSGDPYIEPALLSGFDAVAVIVNVTIQFNKKDFSSLGA